MRLRLLAQRVRQRLLADRERFGRPLQPTRAAWVYGVLTVAASTIWLWPHVLHFSQVPDRGDPIFSAWRLARFAHQLATDPAHLFDGNIFHPRSLTLTYSDATILQGVIGAPFLWLGVEPLIVANALFFVAFPLCGLAFFYAGWRLTGDPRAGVVSGLLGAWYPFHGEHYSHLELQWFMFVPLAFVALLTMVVRPTVRTGLLLGSAIGAQWLASMYLGLMLVTLLLPFGVTLALVWSVRVSAALVRALLAAAAVVVVVCATSGIPYVKSQSERGDRSLAELGPGSATAGDYLDTHRRLATYRWHSRVENRPERELYPGTITIVLALAGVLFASGGVRVALVCTAAAAIELSLGLNGVTYLQLYDWVLAYRGMRVPARFSVLMGSCLILLGAFGAHALLRRANALASSVMLAGLVAVVLIDLRLTTTLVDYWRAAPDIYSAVRSEMVLAEFPAGHDVDYMYFSTQHWARLVGGSSGFMPADPELERIQAQFPSPEAFARLEARGTTHITYNCAFERSPQRCADTLARLDGTATLRLVRAVTWYGAEVRLYEFVARP